MHMEYSFFLIYILVINTLAFIIYTIDFQIYKHGGEGIKPPVLCNIVTILGGTIGTLLAFIVWDRKIKKRNVQSRLYVIFWLIIHCVFLWFLWGPGHETLQAQAMDYVSAHILLCIYIVIINIVTFILFAVDKYKAVNGMWRIREVLLLGLALIGGAVGGLLAMDLCNHKVSKPYFMFGLPFMICIHLVLLMMFT